MEYNFREIEARRQAQWRENDIYRVDVDESRPKYYVLDMFPYPSGAGLHVGHPLGYIASDIYTRYKRLCGFNVLHPMGYDAFGLPAEQYAIQTGQHPAATTAENIARYRSQMDKIGFSYDWSREVRTCDPKYYKWTQWAFEQMFDHWYDTARQKARPIAELPKPEGWDKMTVQQQEAYLEGYRLAYRAETVVNWCEELGTVLANDEVKDGLSVRGGYPVVQKKMMQWLLRVSAYAERLLTGLDTVDWSDSLKEIQRNWVGKSIGAQMFFPLKGRTEKLEIFTTRADTVFGVTFMVLAPEHEMVDELTTDEHRAEVEEYRERTSRRSERERIAETSRVSGAFTGSYAVNPFNGAEIPIYISDYVLLGYGTGAIMAVPAHDSRDWAFARHFGIDIVPVVECGDLSLSSYDAKQGRIINSDFLNGLDVKEAIDRMLDEVELRRIGHRQVNYRLRDAIFSRQRYWGEPFPVYYKDEIPTMLPINKLPLELPEISDFRPAAGGEPPLARVPQWHSPEGYPYETSTMPGFAGSSAYYLRYMSPNDDTALVDRRANNYWRSVDLYIGGIEHATGHLIYSRFWNKFLYDLGYICEDEPFKRLVNQGMIQGRSNFVYRVKGSNKFVSLSLRDGYDTQEIHVDVNIVRNDVLDIEAFRRWRPEFEDAEFVLEDGKYVCGWAVEKMSKSMYNVVNPDHIVENYGADTLRMYEMFLGPLRQSKPWDTNGIDGVHKFLRSLWRNFFTGGEFFLSDEAPTKAELKTLHKTIRKVADDIENFSFNTSVSAFMICLNELGRCNKRTILEPLLVVLSPFAPHIADELWHLAGHTTPIFDEPYPTFNPEYLVESEFEYPVSVNGKLRFKLALALGLTASEIEAAVRSDERTAIYAPAIKKVIVVPGKIINIVA